MQHLIIVQRDWQGTYISHISSSSAAKTFQVSKGGHTHTPSHRLHGLFPSHTHELAAHVQAHIHTHTNEGVSVTADCDSNRRKLLLPLFLSLFLCCCVSPSRFHCLEVLFMLGRTDAQYGCPCLFVPAFLFSCNIYFLLFLPACLPFILHLSVPAHISTSHHQTLFEAN